MHAKKSMGENTLVFLCMSLFMLFEILRTLERLLANLRIANLKNIRVRIFFCQAKTKGGRRCPAKAKGRCHLRTQEK